VLINLSDAVQNIQLDDASVDGMYVNVFTGNKHEAPSIKNLMMEPWSYFVLDKL